MTQLRKDAGAESNFFDRLFDGIGHRGSSFTNVDGLVHDGSTRRFLMMEFKWGGERASAGQLRAFEDFSRLPGCEFWGIRRGREFYDVLVIRDGEQAFRGLIGWDAMKAMYRAWWAGDGWLPDVG